MAEQTFIMIKPDGVQRGLVRFLSPQLSVLFSFIWYIASCSLEIWDFCMNFVIFLDILCFLGGVSKHFFMGLCFSFFFFVICIFWTGFWEIVFWKDRFAIFGFSEIESMIVLVVSFWCFGDLSFQKMDLLYMDFQKLGGCLFWWWVFLGR